MNAAFNFLAVHGDHTFSSVTRVLLHVLHPEHWAVPVLAITGGLLAVYSVRRGLTQGSKQVPRG